MVSYYCLKDRPEIKYKYFKTYIQIHYIRGWNITILLETGSNIVMDLTTIFDLRKKMSRYSFSGMRPAENVSQI